MMFSVLTANTFAHLVGRLCLNICLHVSSPELLNGFEWYLYGSCITVLFT